MRRFFVLSLVALFLGCQQAPPSGPGNVPVGSLTIQLKQEGDALVARGDYDAAVVKYQAAVRQEPGEAPLWFALGTALSHLGQREGTIQAFQRVVELGRPGSQEVEVARRWMVSAGVLSESASVAPPEERASGASTPYSGPTGAVKGNTEWKGVTPENLIAVKITLSADEPATQKQSFARQIRLGQPYAFENVPPGSYRLMAYAGQTQLWDERVTVEADRQVVLHLGPANSPVSTDQFPDSKLEKEHVEDKKMGWDQSYDRYKHATPGLYNPPPPAGEGR